MIYSYQTSFFVIKWQLLDELFEILELAQYWSSLAAVVLGQILLPCGVWSVGKVESYSVICEGVLYNKYLIFSMLKCKTQQKSSLNLLRWGQQ